MENRNKDSGKKSTMSGYSSEKSEEKYMEKRQDF